MSSFFGGSQPAPAPAPIITAPPVMPTPDDAAVKAARKKAQDALINRRGRASTIATQGEPVDTLA